MEQTIEALPQSIAVEIYDQIYHLRGTDHPYTQRLAQVVDAKMRAVLPPTATPSIRSACAVLAALNIADELSAVRQRYEQLAGTVQNSQTTIRSRAGNLSHMLDEILDDRKVG